MIMPYAPEVVGSIPTIAKCLCDEQKCFPDFPVSGCFSICNVLYLCIYQFIYLYFTIPKFEDDSFYSF